MIKVRVLGSTVFAGLGKVVGKVLEASPINERGVYISATELLSNGANPADFANDNFDYCFLFGQDVTLVEES